MRRRDYLRSLGAAGLAATAGCAVLPTGGPDDAGVEPVTVETIAAPGSSAGTATVPASGTVSVVDLFATWCGPCRAQMDSLAAARERVGDDATFVSVTNESIGDGFTREDVAAWWRRNDGRWTVGLDQEGRLARTLGAPGLPYTVVTDADRRVVWSHRGVAEPDALVEQVRTTRPL